MPSSDSAGPDRFSPRWLNRTLLAVPLLEALREASHWFGPSGPRGRPRVPVVPDDPWNAVIVCESDLPSARLRPLLEARLQQVLARFAGRPQPPDPRRNVLAPAIRGTRAFPARLERRVAEELLDARDRDPAPTPTDPLWRIARLVRDEFDVILNLNLNYRAGRDAAKAATRALLAEIKREHAPTKSGASSPAHRLELERGVDQYVFERLRRTELMALAQRLLALDRPRQAREPVASAVPRPNALSAENPVYQIWPDFTVSTCMTRSIATVKANAAHQSFAALGEGITWAVMDTGIQASHPHFRQHGNLAVCPHQYSFLDAAEDPDAADPHIDPHGHGTHVAGILAGEWDPAGPPARAVYSVFDERGDESTGATDLRAVRGMAPKCQLASFKVLNARGKGATSAIIAALAKVQEINCHGRRLLIQGINISIGYEFEPKWFACGQSPLCIEVDRLVKSGVVVVVSAGNTGYGYIDRGSAQAGLVVTINDPGNAELALTVGSTHRDMPYTYGVSFFSSKGPTGDGRPKPDLLAPGEKIASCASSGTKDYRPDAGRATVLRDEAAQGQPCDYLETSGTSMAAPHVSGVIAAFLSARREFIGHPERLKEIFTSTASDLRRDRYFQGAGLIDLMRAIQSV